MMKGTRVQLIIFVIIIAVGVLIISELAVKGIIESKLKDAIESGVDGIESTKIRLRVFPIISLIFSGRINSISIDCKGFPMEGLRIESIVLDASNILIDMQALVKEKRLIISRVEKGKAEIMVMENDLNKYIRDLEGVPESVHIQLNPGQIVIKGYIDVAGIGVPVNIDGGLVIEKDGTCLNYTVDHIRLGSAALPSIITDRLLKGLNLSLDMAQLPIPAIIKYANVEDGALRIIGSISSILTENRQDNILR
ncbi:MAG: DUF2993 domain-containing protein [Firmicutes bacterium]|mgnify:CR=1 FL=1|nr:DUF2993 domain-containing protein [Bacillota bacterium]